MKGDKKEVIQQEESMVSVKKDEKIHKGGTIMKKTGLGKVSRQSQDTLIGAQTTIKGNIYSDKTMRVEGHVEGDIKSNSQIIIGTEGRVKGNIEAENIVIYGRVEGNVVAKVLLEIMNTGKLNGDVWMSKLCIHEGASFNGLSHMEEADKVTNK